MRPFRSFRASVVLAALFAGLVLACGDASSSGAATRRFVLRSVNGQLPGVVSHDVVTTIEVLSGSLTLEDAGSFEGRQTVRTTRNGVSSDSLHTGRGSYRQEGSRLHLQWPSGPVQEFDVRGDILEGIGSSGSVYRYAATGSR